MRKDHDTTGGFGSDGPWTAESLPQSLVDILDRAAGKEHSITGSVRQCLAAILNEYDRLMTRAELVDEVARLKRELTLRELDLTKHVEDASEVDLVDAVLRHWQERYERESRESKTVTLRSVNMIIADAFRRARVTNQEALEEVDHQ